MPKRREISDERTKSFEEVDIELKKQKEKELEKVHNVANEEINKLREENQNLIVEIKSKAEKKVDSAIELIVQKIIKI